ncbi:hypothetical protein [Sorangium sp. So ce131]|uniref:hypothetical protein n=1 Tax=Sorangium sp. So ce131 TaxID=3133282 RepID=UPI003F5F354A
MNLFKIMSTVVAAGAILALSMDGDAAQCRRFPSGAGNFNTYPTSGETRLLNVGCADGTRGDLIVDASPKEVRVTLRNKVTATARVRLIGANSIGGAECVAESTTLNVTDTDPCGPAAVKWVGELRND